MQQSVKQSSFLSPQLLIRTQLAAEGEGFCFFGNLRAFRNELMLMGARGTWATGGGVSNTFYTRQEDEGRDRKKKERKKEVEIPTGERRTRNLLKEAGECVQRRTDGCYDTDSSAAPVHGALLHEGPNGRIRGPGDY